MYYTLVSYKRNVIAGLPPNQGIQGKSGIVIVNLGKK